MTVMEEDSRSGLVHAVSNIGLVSTSTRWKPTIQTTVVLWVSCPSVLTASVGGATNLFLPWRWKACQDFLQQIRVLVQQHGMGSHLQ
jgi:hypothetical protein